MTDHHYADPMDYLDTVLHGTLTRDEAEVISAELTAFGKRVDADLLLALIEEDDRDERMRLVDLSCAHQGQVIAAHRRFIAHVSAPA